MTAPAVFTYESRQLRTVVIDGEPWFVAVDICAVLDIANSRDAVSRLADDEKGVGTTDTLGGSQQVTVVSEAGVYRLIFTSRRPEAETFRRWVTHDVLPVIRQTGSYNPTAAVALPSMKQLAQMVIESETARELAQARVAELEPVAEVATRLLDAEGDYSAGDTAKALSRAGIKVGAGRLFTMLSTYGWIYRDKGDGRWRVYQTAIERGFMSVLPQSHYHPKTGVLVLDPPQPRVTPKGLQKLLLDHGAVSA